MAAMEMNGEFPDTFPEVEGTVHPMACGGNNAW